MQKIGLQIEHQCPQCGAPITLDEADHLISCGFCRVKSFVVSRDLFRYVLPHNAPAGKSLVYVPYWRFKGMLFSCLEEEIHHRIVDSSCQALQSAPFPPSLGLRSQTLKLRFLTPETKGVFLKPRLSLKAFMTLIDQQFRELLPKPIFHQSFIGETLSLIYSPFYVDSEIHDAILNRPLAEGTRKDIDLESLKGDHPNWQIRFVPALCPNCGWDLDGQAVTSGHITIPGILDLRKDVTERMASTHLMKRLATHGEVAHMVTYLLSDMAIFITNCVHSIDVKE